ncbi:22800_t:CDS:2 [Cetraspora pellucida]|uniref:22800_t:CDS:1 n=1 Tax=Cetraspora pellucida TaxID=1433469 RepID=A0A9N9NSI4_9GLOM|nr:22800_t:CDS:2 [Cetraspora pellucida]
MAPSVNEVLSVTVSKKINQLQRYLIQNRHIITAFEYNECQAVYKYFVLLEDRPYQKGIYVDKHERDNVIVYRKKFLEKMKSLEHRMARYEEEAMEKIPLVLKALSEFLLKECGWLKLSEKEIRIHPNIPTEAYKAISIFEAKFPNAMAMFAFNNSTNHGTYAEDALIAARMNLKPGADRQLNIQHMVFEKNYVFEEDEDYDETMREKPKGIKVVLKEKGC